MRALEMAFKDIKTVARDYKALALIIGMPLILIMILGAALGPMFTQGDRIPTFRVAFVDPGSGDLGTYLRHIFSSDELANLVILTDVPGDREAQEAILDGRVNCAIVLPKKPEAQDAASLQISVLGDPGDSIRTEIVRSIVDSFANQYSAVYAATSNIVASLAEAASQSQTGMDQAQLGQLVSSVSSQITERTVFARGVLTQNAMDSTWITALQYYSAGMSAMFVLFGAMLGVKSLIEERKLNTLSRLFASKATKADILLGKTLSTFIISLVQILILIGFTWGVYKVDWGTSLGGVLGVAAAMSFAATGFAMLIGAIAKTERMADAFENIGVQIMAFLGGCHLPIYVFPAALQSLSKLTLTRWGLQGFLTLMEGNGAAAVFQPIVVLIAMGAVFLAIGLAGIRLE